MFVLHHDLRRAVEGGDQTSHCDVLSQEEALEAELDLSKISEQTHRLVHTLFGWTLVIGLWIIWADVLPALKVLDQTVLTPAANTRLIFRARLLIR